MTARTLVPVQIDLFTACHHPFEYLRPNTVRTLYVLSTEYPAAARAPSWCCGPGMDPIDRAACIEAITVGGWVD